MENIDNKSKNSKGKSKSDSTDVIAERKSFIDPATMYDVNMAVALLKVNSRELNYMKRKHGSKNMTISEWQNVMNGDDIMYTKLVG